MSRGGMSAQAAGRIGGLTRAATAPTPQAITEGWRKGRFQRYIDDVKAVMPELADEADIIRRAELLRRADMVRMSAKAAEAKRLKAQLKELEADLDATGLADAGSDGIDAD
jgi:hypothetical protein